MKLIAGNVAPDFRLPADDGTEFRLHTIPEPTLLVFYPGDASPVCTAQLCDYRDRINIFSDSRIQIIGISRDSGDSHQKFKETHGIPFVLLTDRDGAVAAEYGVRTLLGTINRALFLIGSDHKILWFHREPLSIFRRGSDELKTVIDELKGQGHFQER